MTSGFRNDLAGFFPACCALQNSVLPNLLAGDEQLLTLFSFRQSFQPVICIMYLNLVWCGSELAGLSVCHARRKSVVKIYKVRAGTEFIFLSKKSSAI